MDRSAFVSMLMPAAQEASKRTGIDPRIIVAQAALESAWGKSAPGQNYFGVKSHGVPGGQTFATHEYVNGQRVPQQDSFRTYAGPQESVAGYADFVLRNPRYGEFRAAQGLDAQAAALQRSGYATDPAYGAKVLQIAQGLDDSGAPAPQQVASAPMPMAPAPQPQPQPQAAPQGAPSTQPSAPPQQPGGGGLDLATLQRLFGSLAPQQQEMAPPQAMPRPVVDPSRILAAIQAAQQPLAQL